MSGRHRGEVKVKVYPYATSRRLYHEERRKEVGLTSELVWMALKNLSLTGFEPRTVQSVVGRGGRK